MNRHQRQEETKRYLTFDTKMNHLDEIYDDKAFFWRQPSVHAVLCGRKLEQKATQAWDVWEKNLELPKDLKTKGKSQGRHRQISPSLHISSVRFSCSVVSDSWRPHESQHARPPCPSPTPGVYSNSCPASWWCHPAISSSVVPSSSCPQSLPASGSFPMSELFAWGGQSIGVCVYSSLNPWLTSEQLRCRGDFKEQTIKPELRVWKNWA